MALDYSKQSDWEFISGQQQSPIAIDTTTVQPSELSAISWRGLYQATRLTGEPTTMKAYGRGNAYLNDRDFSFEQIHFHTPSEHVLDGQPAAIEWHLVHHNAAGQLAVVAVFGRIGKPNASLQQLLDQFAPNTNQDLATPVDLTTLLPDTGTVYHYLGSLTTPPLTESVEWYVCRDAVMIGQAQLDAYQQLFAPNHRELQPLNDRPIIAERL